MYIANPQFWFNSLNNLRFILRERERERGGVFRDDSISFIQPRRVNEQYKELGDFLKQCESCDAYMDPIINGAYFAKHHATLTKII